MFVDRVKSKKEMPATNRDFLRVHFQELSLIERYSEVRGCTPFWEDLGPAGVMELPFQLLTAPVGAQRCSSAFFPAGTDDGPSFYCHLKQDCWLVAELRHDWHMDEHVVNCQRPCCKSEHGSARTVLFT